MAYAAFQILTADELNASFAAEVAARVSGITAAISTETAARIAADALALPLTGGTINANTTTEAPAYTSGNTSDLVVLNSQHDLAAMWALLDGGTQHDGVSGIARIQAGTSVTQVNAVAGYVDNNRNNVSGGTGVGVALGGFTNARVDGAQNWWIDGIMAETRPNTSPGIPNDALMQGEVDFKPIWANTQVAGLILTLDTAIQPANADAYLVGRFGTGGKWITGFRTYDAAAFTALNVGSSMPTGTPNANSQVVLFTATDSGGANVYATLAVEGSGTAFVVSETTGRQIDFDLGRGNYNALPGFGYYVNGSQIMSDRRHGWAAPTGTVSRATFDQSTVTLPQLAQALAALLQDLIAHGAIGP